MSQDRDEPFEISKSTEPGCKAGSHRRRIDGCMIEVLPWVLGLLGAISFSPVPAIWILLLPSDFVVLVTMLYVIELVVAIYFLCNNKSTAAKRLVRLINMCKK